MRLPPSLAKRLAAYTPLRDTVGMSAGVVYRYDGCGEALYLKAVPEVYDHSAFSLARERDALVWLWGRLRVPEVLDYLQWGGRSWLLTRALPGVAADHFTHRPEAYVALLAEGIRRLWSVDAAHCPLDAGLDVHLAELRYRLDNGLADDDPAHWEPGTPFADGEAIYRWLVDNRPEENKGPAHKVFAHMDLPGNLLMEAGVPGYIDVGRAGLADRWCDIALCVRSIREHCPGDLDRFFALLGVAPDWARIDYYIMLDELF